MKKLYTLLLGFFLIAGNTSFAQLILPQFNPVEKQEISSKEEDSSPLTYNNGNGIYYNRSYTEKDGEITIVTGQDVWFVEKSKKGWGKPLRLLREDDLAGENLIVGTNKTGSRIYVFNAESVGDSLYRRLYYLDKAEKKYKWSAPTEVIIPGLKYGSDFIHFYINPEETAILVSKPPKGRSNDEDLFVSLKDEQGNWGPIIDLGKTINTNRFELGSFLTNDLKTIYFSSEGHGGFGGADIFVSMRLDDSWQNWTKPLNLGEPINSMDYDAFFIMANANEVYFTSDRGDIHSNIYKGSVTGEVVLAQTDSLKALFIHKGKPAVGITFNINDGEGNLISRVITDDKGVFQFEKLKGEEDFVVTIDGEDSDFVGSRIYFLDEENNKSDRYVYTKSGLFVKSKDLGSSEVVQGKFTYNSLPSINTALVVLDENGFPLDTIYTDENGNFTYTVLNLETGFSLVPLNMTDDDFINADIYLIDKEGNKLETLRPRKFHSLLIEDVELVDDNETTSAPTNEGVFVFKSIPALNTGLVVKDHNGVPLDTMYTDDKGKFNYSFLNLVDGFSLTPLDMSEDEFVNVDIYLTDKQGRRLISLSPDELYILELNGEEIALVEYNPNEKPSGIDVENVEGAGLEISAWKRGTAESKTIYFEFQEAELKKSERNKLSVPASIVKLDPSRKIILTGHTDSIGEEAVNYSVGLARASSVRDYLISQGVASSRIDILSKGEKNPSADNSTAAGRVQNRRVEIKVK